MAANAAPKQRRRGRGRPFPTGQSGNPKGKIPGTRHHITLLAERLMGDDIEAVVAKVVRAAKGGDIAAARLIPLWLMHTILANVEEFAERMDSVLDPNPPL